MISNRKRPGPHRELLPPDAVGLHQWVVLPLLLLNAAMLAAGLGFVWFYGRFPAAAWFWAFGGTCFAYATARGRELFLTERAARRAVSQKCVACGYDLRTNPTRCPECGTSVYLSRAYTNKPWWLRQPADRRYRRK